MVTRAGYVRWSGSFWSAILFSTPFLLPAQQIDLSLHSTAVPDSFEVRAASTGAPFTAVPNAVFTVRWEASAGGSIGNEDVQSACGAFALQNFGGTEDIAAHRYFTLNLFGNRPIMNECPITTDGMSIGGFRINGLSACRNVQLVQNAYTGMTNRDYYFSIGGIDVTGEITSDPILGGACGPCTPPVIISASANQSGTCDGPIDLQIVLEGGTSDYSWYGLYSGEPVCYLSNCTLDAGVSGPFLVVSTNGCGVDSMVVEVDVDTAACVPPVITTATYSFIGSGIKFSTTATGTCLQYMVMAPNGTAYTAGWNGNVTCPHSAGLGEYLAITYNTCGADTAIFLIEENPQCNSPQIVSANASVPPCQFSPLTLACTASGPGPISYQWMDPYGVVVGIGTNVTVPEAMAGDYSITASNACGSVWTLIPVALDTAGVGACVPPQVLSVTSNGPICAGDTLVLQAEVIADGPCLNYQWSGSNVVQSGGFETTAPNGLGNYALTVSNACGSATNSVSTSVIELQYDYAGFCGSPGYLLDMDSLIGYQVPGGQWFHEGEPHSNFFDPDNDASGFYFVHHPELGCPMVRIYIIVWPVADAGTGAWVTLCSTDDPVDLFSVLGGSPQPGGSWRRLVGIASFGGTYNPAVHQPNTFIYTVENPACSDTAHVVVSENQATPWYADTDGDGYGDESVTMLACDPPEGYVDNSDDTCPDVYGLMGDACDDGDPATVNDTLDEDCACIGDLPTGIAEMEQGGSALWPNPNRGDAFYVQLPQTSGLVHVTMTDATGRVVLRSSMPASTAPLEVALPGGIAAGTYFVGIVTALGAETMRLVVEQ